MKLEETVEMMTSDDYKERFKAEYHQLTHRRNKLQKMMTAWKKGKLDFEPECSQDLLQWQLRAMDEYIYVLKRRAEIEHIDL